MNIVFICNEYPPEKLGGIGIFTKKLAEGLYETGHKITVIGLYSSINTKVSENVNGVCIIRIPFSTGLLGFIRNRINLYHSLKKINQTCKIDIIECPDFEGTMSYVPKLDTKQITRLHGSHTYFCMERNTKPSKLIRHLENKQLKTSDAIISVSNYTGSLTKRILLLNKHPSVIHNSVENNLHQTFFKKDYLTKKKAIYFGTLTEKKGVYPLSEAWREFHKDNPDWTLTVIGKDTIENGSSCREKMRLLLGTSEISVKFIEHMQNNELIESLKEYDFAILPSFSEAFALAPLEAMAVGLPVIVSSLSSGPELVNHGVDGWLCDPRDPANLLNALNHAAFNETERKNIGLAGKEKVASNFNFDKFMDKNIKLYKQILK